MIDVFKRAGAGGLVQIQYFWRAWVEREGGVGKLIGKAKARGRGIKYDWQWASQIRNSTRRNQLITDKASVWGFREQVGGRKRSVERADGKRNREGFEKIAPRWEWGRFKQQLS